MTCRAHDRAFTLIELLVVVAVIGVLAALVMPAVLGALRSATTTHCKSNLKQIGTGLMAYVTTNSGFVPPTGSPNGAPPHRYPYWYKNLAPYTAGEDIYRCPAKATAAIGYGINHIWCGPDEIYGEGAAMNNRAKELTSCQNPSGTLVICDSGKIDNKDDPPQEWLESSASNTGGTVFFPYDNKPGQHGKYTWWYKGATAPAPRHPGFKTGVLFFDGHVEHIATADIVDDLWDEPACIYDNDGQPKRP